MRKSLLYTAEIIHKISSVQTSKENQIMFTHTTKENRQYSALVATGRKENQVIALICERNGSVLQIEMLWMSQSEGKVTWASCESVCVPSLYKALTNANERHFLQKVMPWPSLLKAIEEGQGEEVINGKSKRSVKNLSWSKALLHFIPTTPAGQLWSLWKWTTGNEGDEPSPQDIMTYSSGINAWWRPQGELDEEAAAQLERPHYCAKWRMSEKFTLFAVF